MKRLSGFQYFCCSVFNLNIYIYIYIYIDNIFGFYIFLNISILRFFITSQIPPNEPSLAKQAVVDFKFLFCFSVFINSLIYI